MPWRMAWWIERGRRINQIDQTRPAQGFGSTHVILKVGDPSDGQHDLFLVYLHLDSIAEGVIPGAQVHQGNMIGAVGQEDATYPHLHFEFRKGGPQQRRSVHPLHYLPYLNTTNFTQLRLDRCNFYRRQWREKSREASLCRPNRRESDVQAVHVELTGQGVPTRELHVDFDDRATINSDKGDEQAFKNGIAVEGYQKSNLKGEGLNDLHYGVLIEDIAPEFDAVKLRVLDVKNEKLKSAAFRLPTLEDGKKPVNSRVGFEEGETFLHRVGNCVSCRAMSADRTQCCSHRWPRLALSGPSDCARDRDPCRAALRLALTVPVRPMSWRLRADIRPAELEMDEGLVIHPLAFLVGDDVVAAACLRKIRNDEFVTGVLIRSADGLFREKMMRRGKNCL